jgi:hypothetical protein
MSAQAYYQSNDNGGGGDRGYTAQPASGYEYNPQAQAQAASQAQQGQYGQQAYGQQPGGYQQGQGEWSPQQPPQVYNQTGNFNQGPNGSYGMTPSAPYAQTNDAESFHPQTYEDTAPFSQANEKTGERMNPKPRFNDIIPLVLFILTFAGFVVVSALALKDFSSVNGLGGGFGRGSGGSSTTLNLYVPRPCRYKRRGADDSHTIYLASCESFSINIYSGSLGRDAVEVRDDIRANR